MSRAAYSIQRAEPAHLPALQAVEQRAAEAGCASVTLTTYRDVPWNAPFYRKLGFRILDEPDLTPALRARLDEEAAEGFSPPGRVAMRRQLGDWSRFE